MEARSYGMKQSNIYFARCNACVQQCSLNVISYFRNDRDVPIVTLLFTSWIPTLTYLYFHGICVDLAHVFSSVLSRYFSNVKSPGIIIVVCDRKPCVVGYHVLVNCQYRLGVRFDPSYLIQ